MSRSIWTRCAGSSEIRPLALEAIRAVESQHVVSTRKLVDSAEEQALLEELVDRVKPPLPRGDRFEALHYLLATPFRHPPLPHGSRFGTRAERGIWYGSLSLATCFAEVAYYRFVFLAGTKAKLAPLSLELTVFRAAVRTRRGVRLTRPPFAEHERALASKTSYAATQALGAAMRADRVEAFVFRSARDPAGGENVALFEPAFARTKPWGFTTWQCTVDEVNVELVRRSVAVRRRAAFVFPRAAFEVGGELPTPAC